VGLELESLARPLAWRELFGDDRPVEMEIGVGKGTFLVEQAKARPEVHFVGIEWSRVYWEYASDRLRRQACFNVRIFRAEALSFLSDLVADSSLAAIHALFPDPWPKRRHHKRRLFQASFVRQLERALEPGGRLQVVTDHEDYFRQVRDLLASSLLRPAEFVPAVAAAEGELAGSNFERKYRRDGRPLFALAAVKPL
jgi:tRNA (guanine-N7-)-methyltransferase